LASSAAIPESIAARAAGVNLNPDVSRACELVASPPVV
jgi:hypothetical protein